MAEGRRGVSGKGGGVTPEKLASRIHELRYYHRSDVFDLFIAETMRRIGMPLCDPPLEEEIAGEMREVVHTYLGMVEQAEPFADILSPVYMHYREGAKAFAGQFFTPWEVCLMMARLTLGDWEPVPHPEGDLWSVLEPAVGAGGTLLAFLQLLVHRHGPEALRMWRVVAWDIDLTVARMAAIQIMVTLARYGWGLGEVVVVNGDTLRQEVRSIVLHGLAKPREKAETTSTGPAQLSLFAEVA